MNNLLLEPPGGFQHTPEVMTSAVLSGRVSCPLRAIHDSHFLFRTLSFPQLVLMSWRCELGPVFLTSTNDLMPHKPAHPVELLEPNLISRRFCCSFCITTGDHMGCSEQPHQLNRQRSRRTQPERWKSAERMNGS